MAKDLYSQDNAAYRQYLANMLQAIKNSVDSLNNLDGANIKSGVELLGNVGTFSTEDIATAATALDIAAGKVAYVNGEKIIGLAGIAEYTLTVDETGVGTGTGSVTVDEEAYAAPVDYKAGIEVELVATPDEGSVFVNWTIGGTEVSDEATYTYIMETSDVTIVANFDLE